MTIGFRSSRLARTGNQRVRMEETVEPSRSDEAGFLERRVSAELSDGFAPPGKMDRHE